MNNQNISYFTVILHKSKTRKIFHVDIFQCFEQNNLQKLEYKLIPACKNRQSKRVFVY